jgi:hypothetical protein
MFWPPAITDSHTQQVLPSQQLPAKLKRCGVYSVPGNSHPYLSIVFEYKGRDWHAMIHDIPLPLMRCVVSTLAGHEGRSLSELGDLQIQGNGSSTSER